MKKVILFTMSLCVVLIMQAQTNATINVTTPGTFAVQLINAGFIPSKVTDLTVTGSLNDDDIKYMNSNLSLLTHLNLKEATLANNSFPSQAFYKKTTLVSVSIPRSIEYVGTLSSITYVFYGCKNLTSVDLSGCNRLKTIGSDCFRECTKLATIDLSSCTSLEMISTSAFNNCSVLTEIDLSTTNIKTIRMNAFNQCNALKKVVFPASLISIESDAFSNCSALQILDFSRCVALQSIEHDAFSLMYPDTNPADYLSEIDFSSCISLKSVSYAFKNRAKVKKMDLSKCKVLTDIDFEYMTGLQEVTLPPSISNLSYYIFSGCSSLQRLTVMRNIPPTFSNNATFASVSQSTCKLIVPTGAKTAYMIAAQWGNFVNIEEQDFPDMETLFNISITCDANGQVSNDIMTGNNIQVKKDSAVTFTITPQYGYTLSTITFNGTDVRSQVIQKNDLLFTYKTPPITSTSTLVVTFKEKPVILTIKSSDNGSVGIELPKNSTQSIHISPTANWNIYSVTYNYNDVTSSLINGTYITPAITGDAQLNVIFVENTTAAPELIISNAKVYTSNTDIIIEGIPNGETVKLHSINGSLLQTIQSTGEKISIPVQQNSVYLVQTKYKTFKVIM